jgi:AraC-like DNA-binding protein
MRAEPNVAWYYEAKLDQLPIRIAYEGTDAPTLSPPVLSGLTTLVCGFISCDLRPFNPLVAALPRMLRLPAADNSGWSAQFLQQAVAESHANRLGSEAMRARMSEMLFVDAVRRYVETVSPDGVGWIAGLRDRFVGRALALLHERPAESWTIDELGREVGLSRSARCMRRFVQFVGQPPMQYLGHWRMQLASVIARFERDGGRIALDVGYDSEAAFSRAFKRLVVRALRHGGEPQWTSRNATSSTRSSSR